MSLFHDGHTGNSSFQSLQKQVVDFVLGLDAFFVGLVMVLGEGLYVLESLLFVLIGFVKEVLGVGISLSGEKLVLGKAGLGRILEIVDVFRRWFGCLNSYLFTFQRITTISFCLLSCFIAKLL